MQLSREFALLGHTEKDFSNPPPAIPFFTPSFVSPFFSGAFTAILGDLRFASLFF